MDQCIITQALSALQRTPGSRPEGRTRSATALLPEAVRQGSYRPPRRLYFDSFRSYLAVWVFRSVAASGLR